MFRSVSERRAPQPVPTQRPPGRIVNVKGLFDGGRWKCDCNPRKNAVRFVVRKDGPNHGREFYRCVSTEGCNFFLWREEAIPREDAPAPPPTQTPPSIKSSPGKRRFSEHAGYIPYPTLHSSPPTPSKSRNKPPQSASFTSATASFRTAPTWDSDTEEDEFVLVDCMTTPRKERRTAAKTSPTKRVSVRVPGSFAADDDDAATVVDEDIFSTPYEQGRPGLFARPARPVTPPPSATRIIKTPVPKTPTRRLSAQVFTTPTSYSSTRRRSQSASTAVQGGGGLVKDVFDLLYSYGVDLRGTDLPLQELLERQVRMADGYYQGREITREVLKKRDADIVKLKDKLKAQRQEFLGVQKDLESATSDLHFMQLSQSSLQKRT